MACSYAFRQSTTSSGCVRRHVPYLSLLLLPHSSRTISAAVASFVVHDPCRRYRRRRLLRSMLSAAERYRDCMISCNTFLALLGSTARITLEAERQNGERM
jgi:hypothetical protein